MNFNQIKGQKLLDYFGADYECLERLPSGEPIYLVGKDSGRFVFRTGFGVRSEARALDLLSDVPYCVDLVETYESYGRRALIKTFAEGIPLDKSPMRTMTESMLEQMVSFVEEAHKRGVFSLDLAEGNIIVGNDELKFFDFNLAVFYDEEQAAFYAEKDKKRLRKILGKYT